MLRRLHELAAQRESFAFETTLASRSFAPWIRQLRSSGYTFHLLFLWLPTPDFAVQRVAVRVRLGGHNVPETTVRRRYAAGLRDSFTLYLALADTWRMYDNSTEAGIQLIAAGERSKVVTMGNAKIWDNLRKEYQR